ncbi:MAG: hypothetical protein Q9215_004764 [Flavoplaca cf. flavocitrina]
MVLTYGHDINDSTNTFDPTALAAALDDEEIIRWLLRRGADPSAERTMFGERIGETPLSKAMLNTSFKLIRLMFRYGGPDSINSGSLLWYAINRNLPDRLQLLKYLLRNGTAANLNKLMYHDRPEAARQADWAIGRGTPLHSAAGDRKIDVSKLFIRRGADPSIRDAQGRLPIDKARERKLFSTRVSKTS